MLIRGNRAKSWEPLLRLVQDNLGDAERAKHGSKHHSERRPVDACSRLLVELHKEGSALRWLAAICGCHISLLASALCGPGTRRGSACGIGRAGEWHLLGCKSHPPLAWKHLEVGDEVVEPLGANNDGQLKWNVV